jgi:hypothetical protein
MILKFYYIFSILLYFIYSGFCKNSTIYKRISRFKEPDEAGDVFYQCDHIFDTSSCNNKSCSFSFPFPPSYSEKAQKKLISTNPKLFDNIQCIYSFVAGQRQRVKLDFIDFQLAGTKDNCDQEYIDIYSELKTPSDDLLTSMTPTRYCGSVSPHVRISLHNVIVIVFHSRVGKKRSDKIKVYGKYHFISDSKFNPGRQLPGEPCSFIIDASEKFVHLFF